MRQIAATAADKQTGNFVDDIAIEPSASAIADCIGVPESDREPVVLMEPLIYEHRRPGISTRTR